MKNLMALLFLVPCGILFAQEENDSNFFSSFEWGAYGGINSKTFSETGGTFLTEVKTNLSSNLNLKFSLGYYRSIKTENYTVKTYSKFSNDTTVYFYAGEYDVTKTNYDVFPISIGLQYLIKNPLLSPYILFDFNYNIISASYDQSGGNIWTYSSFDQIPDEYKTKPNFVHSDHSYGISFGIGTLYHIAPKLNLDFRYFYKIDNKTINTHQVIVGISI
jgi:hypothetical protein